MTAAHVRARHYDLRTHRSQMEDLLLAHLVRNHQQQAIAFAYCNKRQRETGIAGGSFDERASGCDLALAFRGLDHRKCDAVFDRAAGVLIFEFYEELARSRIQLGELNQWCIPNQIENIGHAHALASVIGSSGRTDILDSKACSSARIRRRILAASEFLRAAERIQEACRSGPNAIFDAPQPDALR